MYITLYKTLIFHGNKITQSLMSSIFQSSLKLNIFKISHQVLCQIHFLNINLKISTSGSELHKVFVDYTLKANHEQCINYIVVSGNIYFTF